MVEIKPQAGRGLLVGQVKRADGRSPFVDEEFFGVYRTAEVRAFNGAGNKVAESVRTNAAGEFAIAGLPRDSLQVRATMEAAVATQAIPEGALSFGEPALPVTLMFNEAAPQIVSVTTNGDQKSARSAGPGATVTVTANVRSSDKDALKFNWRLQEGMGVLRPAGASAVWTLPTEPGPYAAYVMVSDGLGGYATGSVSVLVGVNAETSTRESQVGAGASPANGPDARGPSLSPTLGTNALPETKDAGGPQASTTCITVLVGSPSLLGSQLTVSNSTGPVIQRVPLNQSVVSVSGLPANANLTLRILSEGGLIRPNPYVTFATAPLSPLPDNVLHTGMPGACQTLKLTEYPAPTGTSFLTFKGVGTMAIATGYYAAVDPASLRGTLGAWWEVNGFDASGKAAGEVRTSYLNNNDLGSGRDMHFLQHSDGTVSAYVTNYVDPPGDFNQNPSYADSAAGQDPTRRAASVCMEYSPIERTTQRIVKFFVYTGNGNGANAPLTTSVDLDGNGPKFVPNLCLNCHGGDYVPNNPDTPSLSELNMMASFREFDLATFKYPGGPDVPSDAERAAFKQQNLIARGDFADTISTQGIKNLVNGWYGILQSGFTYVDPDPSFTGQNTSFNPPGWNDQNPPASALQSTGYLYHSVVAKSCRTCHVAFSNNLNQGPNGEGIDWTTFAQFQNDKALILSYVTTSSMPHSQITYKNFWNSRNPSAAEVLTNFTGW